MAGLTGAAGAVAATALLLLGGCAGEPEELTTPDGAVPAGIASATAPAASPSPTGPAAADGESARFCRAVTAVDTAAAKAPDRYPGSPGPDNTEAARAAFVATYAPLLEQMEQTAPPSLAGDVATFVRLAREAATSPEGPLPTSAEHAAADSAVDDYLAASCGYPRIAAYAVDYEFDQLPGTAAAGPTALSLRNDGQELHHLLLVRLADDAPAVDELLDLPAGEAAAELEAAALVEAKPGTTNLVLADLRPGRYAAVCYVPEGSKRGAVGDGAPHHAEGMVADLTVT